MKIIKTEAKEIYTKTKLPGADYVLNQYVGCQHACTYCYAKFICRWKDFGKFGTWVEAKINAPELVARKTVKGEVFMSSMSDPYQQVEKELELTKRVLENLDKNTKLSILTKSNLILRDLKLLKQFKNLEVGFTINDFEGKTKDLMEPFAPSYNLRLEALKTLNKEGIKTYVFVSPIVPGLIDLKTVINNTKQYSDHYWFEFMNLRGAGSEFVAMMQKVYPESLKILQDKKLMVEFVKECDNIIKKSGVKYSGIEQHNS